MNIWLIQIGEPVPLEKKTSERLLRTGILYNLLAERNNAVTWWASTFDRVRRSNLFDETTIVYSREGLCTVLLHAHGYKKSISIARLRYHRNIAKAFKQAIRDEEKPDIILCSYPTIELCKVSVDYGKRYNIPVIIDIRDMWPDILVDVVPRIARTIVRKLIKPMFRDAESACARAYAIIGITDAFVDWGISKAKRLRKQSDRSFPMGYSTKVPEENLLHEAESFWDKLGVMGGAECFTVSFMGTLGHQFDIKSAIGAAKKLQETRGSHPFRFVMCGSGDMLSQFKKMVSKDDKILFPGWVNAAQMYVLMRRSQVGLNPIPDRYDFLATINNKAIEYFSAGLPIVLSPQKGVLFELVRTRNCGLGYDPGDVDGLVRVLDFLATHPQERNKMSENALHLFHEKFVAEKVYGQMIDYLEEVVTNHHAKRVSGI